MTSETAAPATIERPVWIRRQVTGILALLVDQVVEELGSTAGGSLEEQVLTRAMRPFLPKLRTLVLSKLSASDGSQLELIAGAIATGIDETLAAAPGDPLPRMRPVWTADRKLALEPLVPPAPAELEGECAECPDA